MELTSYPHAPIACFGYNRPEHFAKTIEALRKNEGATESDLYVFLDGPKANSSSEKVNEVRKIASTIEGFRSVQLFPAEKNRGLAASIVSGIDFVLEKHDRLIVLEDDLMTSPHFLRYMNQALALYDANTKVGSIHGYLLPLNASLPESFFLRGADCWGWATWKRAWKFFEPDGRKLLHELRAQGLLKLFDYQGGRDNLGMLQAQVDGKVNSWAIRWHASLFLQNMMTLYPGRSLVRNIGNDQSGTHGDSTSAFDCELSDEPIRLEPLNAEPSQDAMRAIRNFHLRNSRIRRLLRSLGRVCGWNK